jgi:UrcA family protein
MANFTIRSFAASAAAVATFVTLAAATPLRAEPVKVAYGDLDISSPAGASELQARIGRAARLACGQDDAGTRIEAAICRQKAIKSAEAQLALKADRTDVRLASR